MQMKTPFAIALVGSLLLSLGPVAEAETAEVKVPKQGWSIFFDSPPLTNKRDSKKGGDYAFMAGSGRFNVSLYVEKPHGSGDTHKACYEFYWPKGSQNPMIAKDTVDFLLRQDKKLIDDANLRIDVIRRERRPELSSEDFMPESEPMADDGLAQADDEVRLRAALKDLPADQIQVVELSFFADKPHSQIAAELDIPLGTVKSRLRLAMARLKRILGEVS